MLKVSGELQRKIEEILGTIREIEVTLEDNSWLSPEQIAQISYTCSELALEAFAASDAVEQEPGLDDEDTLQQTELAQALWQIAFHCIDVQAWIDDLMLRAHFSAIGKHCHTIRVILGMEEEEKEEQAGMLHIRIPKEFMTASAAGAGKRSLHDMVGTGYKGRKGAADVRKKEAKVLKDTLNAYPFTNLELIRDSDQLRNARDTLKARIAELEKKRK